MRQLTPFNAVEANIGLNATGSVGLVEILLCCKNSIYDDVEVYVSESEIRFRTVTASKGIQVSVSEGEVRVGASDGNSREHGFQLVSSCLR